MDRIYIRENNEEQDYDMLDEVYIKIKLRKDCFISELLDGIRDGLYQNELGERDLEYIERLTKIINKFSNIYLEGLYINISTLKLFLLFKSMDELENCLLEYEGDDDYRDIQNKLEYATFYVEDHTRFTHFKLAKEDIKKQLSQRGVDFLLNNATSFFSCFNSNVKTQIKSIGANHSDSISASRGTSIKDDRNGDLTRNSSVTFAKTDGWNTNTTFEDKKANGKMCELLEITDGDEYEGCFREISMETMAELRRIKLMVD